jgi:hypothetical protein
MMLSTIEATGMERPSLGMYCPLTDELILFAIPKPPYRKVPSFQASTSCIWLKLKNQNGCAERHKMKGAET